MGAWRGGSRHDGDGRMVLRGPDMSNGPGLTTVLSSTSLIFLDSTARFIHPSFPIFFIKKILISWRYEVHLATAQVKYTIDIMDAHNRKIKMRRKKRKIPLH
jgi:hypothetical protein